MSEQSQGGGGGFKRRVLGKGRPSQGPQTPRNPQQPGQQAQNKGNQPQGQNRNQRPQGQRAQQQNQPRQGNRKHEPGQQRKARGGGGGPNQNRSQNQNQNQNRGRGQNQGRGRDGRARPQPRPQAPPPAFLQRDLLLVPSGIEGIQKVRTQFDPLHSKVPAHVTIITPKNKDALSTDLIKTIDLSTLPDLKNISFSRVIIRNDKYLWLIPDQEGAVKLKSWHDEFQKLIKPVPHEEAPPEGAPAVVEDIDDEKDEMVKKALADLAPQSMTPDREFDEDAVPFEPHITLGYVPKSKSEEDVMKITQEALSLPIILQFESLLLEEFGENQISVPVETIKL